jgi:predicted helicase
VTKSITAQLASELATIAREIEQKYGDIIAQTTVYGLFLKYIEPQASVDHLTCSFSDSDIIWRIENIILEHLEAVRGYYSSQGKDAAIYFYEEFLRAYNPDNARGRGVHYSPPEVVSYIVRGVESILENTFGESLGNAIIIDPCCGVGTFLRYIEQHTTESPKMIGMELSPAACKLASCLLSKSNVIQADSLAPSPGGEGWGEGATLAIIGNPPYSGHSTNTGNITNLIDDYKIGLTERNPKWLQDDYVKFIRMAQHRIHEAGRGIVAFITNHSYIFNPTFRAMRASLMREFDEIYILDLHGNAKIAEMREADENVFPIRMGVAVSFMVKKTNVPGCRIFYADLRGTRESKLRALSEMDFTSTPWREVGAAKPFFLFKSHDDDLYAEYSQFPSLFDIFNASSVGFVTSRDAFAVAFDKDALLERIEKLRDAGIPAEQIRAEYPVGDLDIEKARQILHDDPNWQDRAIEALFRPFDRRWAYYSKVIMERPRLPFMENMVRDNIALAIGRAGQATGSDEWDVVFCTDCPTDLNLFRRGGAMIFPRYIYQDEYKFSNMKWRSSDKDKLFYYIYAVLHSSIYRARYRDFLRIDYPRIPITTDTSLLSKLAELGEELVSIHLMRGACTESSDRTSPMRIGGYEIPRKYIKDRKYREMTEYETVHLKAIKTAVAKTYEIRARIDEQVITFIVSAHSP